MLHLAKASPLVMADNQMEDLDHTCVPKWVNIMSIFAGVVDQNVWGHGFMALAVGMGNVN